MKMRKDQQVRAACKLLAPSSDQREKCKNEIAAALNRIEFSTKLGIFNLGLSSKEIRAVEKLIVELRRAKTAYISLSKHDHIPDVKIDFDGLIERYKKWLAQQSVAPRHRTSIKQQKSVWEARVLMWQWGHPARTTRNGKWCRLAAILYGDEEIDMFNHVRRAQAHLRKTNQTFRRFIAALGK